MFKLTLLCSLILVYFTSCKDYLDVKVTSGQTTPNSLDALQRILDNAEVMNINTNPLGEASADSYFLLPSMVNSLGIWSTETYTWSIKNNTYPNDWAKSYLTVYHSNVVLDNLKVIPRTESNRETWDRILGSAYFYKSYAYLNLLWTYAKGYEENGRDIDLGIVLRNNSDPSIVSTRSTIGKCYDEIVDNLKKSISLLPKVSEHVLRPGKGAAYGLLARTYLSMREYEKVELYADSAWAISSNLLDYNSIDNGSFPLKRYNSETLFYTQMSNTMPAINYYNSYVDTLLYNEYAENDLRSTFYFVKGSDKYYQFKGSYSGATDFFTGISNAEILLMRAESSIRNGKVTQGLNDLDLLMNHRFITGKYISTSTLNKDIALEIVLRERRKELLFRGLRWMDIKRLNLEGGNIRIYRHIPNQILILEPNDNRFALPIPNDLVDLIDLEPNP